MSCNEFSFAAGFAGFFVAMVLTVLICLAFRGVDAEARKG